MTTQISNRDRLLTLLGTIITQFALGSVYTWSLFNSQLADKLSVPVSRVAFSFGILSLSLAIASSLSGKLQERFGVRKVTICAGLLLGASLTLTAYASNLILLYIFAGLLVGFADGTGYLMTLSNCVKLFPERKGLVSACAIGAYGLGSLGFKYINMYFLTNSGLENTFSTWGLIAMVMVIIGGLMMKDAPKQAPQSTAAAVTPVRDYTLAEAVRSSQFWMLALVFLTVCMSGLYVIGVAKDIGESYVHLPVAIAASSVALIAVANLSGRLVLGVLSDRISCIKVIAIALFICLAGVSALLFAQQSMFSFYFAVVCIAFSFGGTITVYPSLISDFFGLNNLTKNYGLIYLGFGLGSIIGSIVASVFGGFAATFYLMLGLLVISLIITLTIKLPGSLATNLIVTPRHRPTAQAAML
ncbi:OFA family MFS transporter [Moritella marina ATCC 15381]|uniref:OFA family MFS transporter n=1 Tax=Moritella marina ATCC 15381 TaxID=1202962 RepID=A0A5J6WKT1_MORMI|nr:OFA family MFS transporter [Moritella marina]QFI38723.1 OFA family MFS transporter [Moritella marina ATCC 15381]